MIPFLSKSLRILAIGPSPQCHFSRRRSAAWMASSRVDTLMPFIGFLNRVGNPASFSFVRYCSDQNESFASRACNSSSDNLPLEVVRSIGISILRLDPSKYSSLILRALAMACKASRLGRMMPFSYREMLCLVMAPLVRSTSLSMLSPIICRASRNLIENDSLIIIVSFLIC